jgi:uncharacterized protein
MNRRLFCSATGASWVAAGLGGCATPTVAMPELRVYAAGAGSAFLPYAQGLVAFLATQGVAARTFESRGSIENLQRVNAEPQALGLAFLGTAQEAVNGSAPWTEGQRLTRLRALFPMYETSFQIAARSASGLSSLLQLQGQRVGVGPAGGPAESFFKGLVDAVGLQVNLVNGSPAALVTELEAGRIDALWQGAAVPVPALKQLADGGQAVIFGLSEGEVLAMRKRFPFLSATTVAAGTYRGQTRPIQSVAAWNFVVANEALHEAHAYQLTRSVLSLADPLTLHASAGPTRAENARHNTVLPFHAGALRWYRERGVVLA